jgi:hypothetical protein
VTVDDHKRRPQACSSSVMVQPHRARPGPSSWTPASYRRWQLQDVVDEVAGSSSPRKPAEAPREGVHQLAIDTSQPPVLRRIELLTAPLLLPAAAEAELPRRQRCSSPPSTGTTGPSVPLALLAPSLG